MKEARWALVGRFGWWRKGKSREVPVGKRESRAKVGRYWELKGRGGCEFYLGV